MEGPFIEPTKEERAPLEVDSNLVSDVSSLLESEQREMIMNLVADLYPADLALLVTHLPVGHAKKLFHWLPSEQGGMLLTEVDEALRIELLEDAHAERVTELLEHLETDDAADIIADLAPEVADQVLPALRDSEDLRELLAYDEESAGGIMGTEFVSAPVYWTVAEATEAVRRNSEIIEEIYAIFVVDEEGRLVGTVSVKDLLLNPADARLSDIMDTDAITVTPEVDQEEVARIMQRYDIVSLPVISSDRRMLGRITIDDVVDVIREEAEEDIKLLSGVSGSEDPAHSILRVSRGRLPWIFVGMFGAAMAGFLIRGFEAALEEALILASFIPIMMSTAGNVGIQCAAIVVQGLASGQLWSSDIIRQLFKELRVALVNGFILSASVGLVVLMLPSTGENMPRLAATASLSLMAVTVLATIVGTTVPLVLERIKIDPALATGPFITTSNDIIGLAVYFYIATMIYL